MRILLFIVTFTNCVTSFFAKAEEHLEVTGFARAVGGFLDTDKASFKGYEKNFSVSEKSLIAIQTDLTLVPNFSASAQFLLHSADDRDSGVEWLYVTYSPNLDLEFNAGRLRTPFLKYSDVIDVGFAYPWISTPQQLYGSYLFSQYEGISLRYRQRIGKMSLGYEGYYGQYNDNVISMGSNAAVNVNGLLGGVIEANYDGFQIRLASVNGNKVTANITEITPLIDTLVGAGFGAVAEQFNINGSANALLFGLSYDSLSWYANTEWMRLTSNINVLGTISSFYVSAGYYMDEVLLHLTLASSNQSATRFQNTVPLDVSLELDLLHESIEQLSYFFPTNDLNSVTLGARWDFKRNMALKAEMSVLRGKANQTSFFEVKSNTSAFNREAVLTQVALEWVF